MSLFNPNLNRCRNPSPVLFFVMITSHLMSPGTVSLSPCTQALELVFCPAPDFNKVTSFSPSHLAHCAFARKGHCVPFVAQALEFAVGFALPPVPHPILPFTRKGHCVPIVPQAKNSQCDMLPEMSYGRFK